MLFELFSNNTIDKSQLLLYNVISNNHHLYDSIDDDCCQYKNTKGVKTMLANTDIRAAAKSAGVRLWELADHFGISEPTVTRKLRRELPQGEKQRIFSAIEEIAKEKSR